MLKILPAEGDLEGNLGKLRALLQAIKTKDIDVFITSECYLDGYIARQDHIDRQDLLRYGLVEQNKGVLGEIAGVARTRGSWFILGGIHNTEEGPKNAAFIFDRDGRIAGIYHKIHLQKHDRKFVAGTALPVFKADFGTFGVLICADRRWPEAVRTLALKGALVIFNPSYGMHGDKNEMMMRTRSYESEVSICFCHPLLALVTNADGQVEARLVSNRDHYLLHDIELQAVVEARNKEHTHLKDRVSDIYR